MSATVTWDDSHIVRLNVEQPWTRHDCEAAVEAALFMVAQTGEPVHMLVDLTQIVHTPSENLIKVFRLIAERRPLNLCTLLIVASAALERDIERLLPAHCPTLIPFVRFAGTLDVALEMLAEPRLVPC